MSSLPVHRRLVLSPIARRWARVLACLAALAWPWLLPAAEPAPMQSLDAIRSAALAAVGGEGATGEARLDSRLRLVACSQPLDAVASSARMVQVRCPDAPGWKLYVPVTVRREADVVVVSGPVRAGVPIDASQLSVQRRDVGAAAGPVFTDPSQLAGRVPTRSMGQGAVPTEGDLQQGQPLKRGDPVVLVSRTGGIEVRMPGTALGAAQVGDRVAVQNTASGKVVRGRLTSEPGTVDVLP